MSVNNCVSALTWEDNIGEFNNIHSMDSDKQIAGCKHTSIHVHSCYFYYSEQMMYILLYLEIV